MIRVLLLNLQSIWLLSNNWTSVSISSQNEVTGTKFIYLTEKSLQVDKTHKTIVLKTLDFMWWNTVITGKWKTNEVSPVYYLPEFSGWSAEKGNWGRVRGFPEFRYAWGSERKNMASVFKTKYQREIHYTEKELWWFAGDHSEYSTEID